MSRTTKILLGVFAVGLASVCIVCGVGAVWGSRKVDALVAETRPVIPEARRWGSRHVDTECVDEALRRYRAEDGMRGVARAEMFELACLVAATPSPGFCDRVPGRTDVLALGVWKRAECSRRGFPDDRFGCEMIVQGIAEYCARFAER